MEAATAMPEPRPMPPVTQVGMASLALIVAGGIYLAAHLPESVPLTPAIVLLALSAILLAANLFSLTRVKDFAWWRFLQVGRWALLAYAITAGFGFGFFSSKRTAMLAGSSRPRAMTAMQPTTM